MAAVTHRVTTPDTGNTPNTSGAFTPSLNDLLIVFMTVEASVSDPGNLTSSVGGFTFTQVRAQLFRSSVDSLYCFVSNALVSSATSQTVTTTPGDAGAGSIISVYSVSGMTNTGSSAIRQSGGQSNQGSGTIPAPAFGGAALTDNCCLGAVANASNPANVATPPSGWTESQDTGYTTGAVTGLETVFRNSGETGTTITWGSASITAFASIVVELDTSAPAAPTVKRLPALGVG